MGKKVSRGWQSPGSGLGGRREGVKAGNGCNKMHNPNTPPVTPSQQPSVWSEILMRIIVHTSSPSLPAGPPSINPASGPRC